MERNKDILNKLNSISSSLAKATAKMPYHVPEYYFDNLSDRILAKVQLYENEDTQPSSSYHIPSGYFETFPQQVLEKAKHTETDDIIYQPQKQKINSVITVLGTLALIFIAAYTLLHKPDSSIEAQLAGITTEEIDNYIAANVDNYTLETFEDNLLIEDIDITNYINGEDITNYLNDAGMEYENIN